MDERRRTLAARREHSKGDGNFPAPEPTAAVLERPEDRIPEDVPKEDDTRSAPKGNVTKGQQDRNPALETRDEYRPERPAPKSGFEEALEVADDTVSDRAKPAARPNARRSSAAKRAALPRMRSRPPVEAAVPRAPKSSAKTGKRAAAARRAQPGTRKTGAARRGGAVAKAARGSVTARKAKKASRAKPRRPGR